MKLPSEILPEPEAFEAYYDAGTRQYWIRNNRGGWVQVNKSALRSHLKLADLTNAVLPGAKLNQIEEFITKLHTEKDVAYAGPLAGYHSGLLEIMGNRFLVTESPRFIEKAPGEWPVLRQMLENMFVDSSGESQLPFVFGWLKVAIEALYSGSFRPGQALVIAGERACGKSLFQKLLTVLFGGRFGKPYQYLMARTTFNSDLFQAEHLMLEDESSSVSPGARRELGNRIKDLVVNDDQRMHAKHRTAIPIRVFWRLSISLNDEPNNLLVLPPMEPSLEDKIILLKAHRKEMPMPTSTMAQRELFMRTLLRELPAFVHFLYEWEIPESMKDDRFGITHFHHPDIRSALDELSPEDRLLEMITHHIFHEMGQKQWSGSATELQGILATHDAYGPEAKTLFSGAVSLGYYLQRLHDRYPLRVYQKKDGIAGRKWTILPENTEGESLI